MNATHAVDQVRAQPAPSRRGSFWRGSGRTHLAPLAIKLSLHLRWFLVPIALSGYLLGEDRPWPIIVVAWITVFNGFLYVFEQHGQHQATILAALADFLFISLLIAMRGAAGSEFYLLYTLPLFYLGLRYGWRGAVAALVLAVGSYLTTLYVTGAPDLAVPGPRLALRGVYFVFCAIVVSLIVREQELNGRQVEEMHERAREQVRRLEAMQRITQQLNTAPTTAEVAHLIAEETRGVISFKNCRVHMVERDDEDLSLSLVAFYGEMADARSSAPAALRVRLGEGLTGWVALHGEPALVHDAMQDPRAQRIPGTPAAPNSLLAVPLMVNSQVKGVIVLSQAGAGAFREDDLKMMMTLANAASIALNNIESRESLARQATIDSITGLPHHGAFQAALAQALMESAEREEALGLALLDIDGFRGYNERMGLAAADETLRRVATALVRVCRAACDAGAADDLAVPPPSDPPAPPSARAFRVGGDEFALILTGPQGQIDHAIETVGACIQAVATAEDLEPMLRVTLSAGLAFFPIDAFSRRELLDTAEAALYLVRQTGGNRLGLADAEAKETLRLRHTLETMVQDSLAESGSASAVQHLVAEAANVSQQTRHTNLAEQLTTEALRALAAAIDAKDDYTRGHSERVATTSAELARWLNLPAALIAQITTAARMHDIGKIGVPDDVLHKRGPLSSLEQAIMATHPDIGADILAQIHTLQPVVPIVRHHHEHYDGKGYPQGLVGEAIPLGARVVAVADAIDAMITDRPYRRGMHITAALAELKQWAGDHYDPQVVAAAMQLYGPGGTGIALRGVLNATPPAPGELPDPAPADIAPVLDVMMHPEPVSAPADFPLLRELLHESTVEAHE